MNVSLSVENMNFIFVNKILWFAFSESSKPVYPPSSSAWDSPAKIGDVDRQDPLALQFLFWILVWEGLLKSHWNLRSFLIRDPCDIFCQLGFILLNWEPKPRALTCTRFALCGYAVALLSSLIAFVCSHLFQIWNSLCHFIYLVCW